MLYVSLGFKRYQLEYYERLSRVRTHGDWERWIEFFLRCVIEAADDGVSTAQRLFQVIGEDRSKAIQHKSATVNSLRLFELLPQHPVVTLARAGELLATTKPTTQKAIDSLCAAHVLHEVTGRKRDRVYALQSYIDVLGTETLPIPRLGVDGHGRPRWTQRLRSMMPLEIWQHRCNHPRFQRFRGQHSVGHFSWA